MGFTGLLENLTPMVDLSRILAGLGVVTVLLAFLKRNFERRRWWKFKVRVAAWMDRLGKTQNRHPRQLNDDEWKAECERMLTDSKFPPIEINQILETSVIVAKGIAADRFFM